MSKFKAFIAYFIARFKEPSSLAAISAVSALAGANVDADTLQAVFTVSTLVFGTLSFFIKEG